MGTGPVSGISGLLVSSQIKQGRRWEVEAVRTGLIPHPSALHSLLGKTHGIRDQGELKDRWSHQTDSVLQGNKDIRLQILVLTSHRPITLLRRILSEHSHV